jgi:hypothetical protein
MKPGLDSLGPNVQTPGRLGHRHALDRAEYEDRSIKAGQRIDRAFQHQSEFVVIRLPLRISRI